MSGLDLMKQRLNLAGGNINGRMVQDKFNSFHASLDRAYQSEVITFKDNQYQCLINPDKNNIDYSQKVISIDFSAGLRPGDTFLWDRTNKHWIVMLEHEEEKAYFRAHIRRCDYQVKVNNTNYWIYLKGPGEKDDSWTRRSLEIENLNYSMLLYITKNDETKDFFVRNKIFKFDGHNWKVAAVDRYTQDGIIEVYIGEYYDNEMEDVMIEQAPEQQDTSLPHIEGPQVVRPYDKNITYSIVGSSNSEFVVNSTKVKIIETTGNTCKLNVLTGKAGSFTISYGDISLDVTIKSL